jgi:hypothetical protein
MKPYFSKKSCSSNNKIILQEGENIVSDNQEVAEVFNEFFVNVAMDIGKDYIFDEKNHPSLKKILIFFLIKMLWNLFILMKHLCLR